MDTNPQQHFSGIDPQEGLNHQTAETVPDNIGPENLAQLENAAAAQSNQKRGTKKIPQRLIQESRVKEGTRRVLVGEVG